VLASHQQRTPPQGFCPCNRSRVAHIRYAHHPNDRGALAHADWYPCAAPGLQLPGVLDELFTYSGPLGATITDSAAAVAVWAPTAQHVSFRVETG
jgi:hypothetical protein